MKKKEKQRRRDAGNKGLNNRLKLCERQREKEENLAT